MRFCNQRQWLTALGIGLVVGLAISSGYWPHTPLHAVATDRAETYGMATGAIDQEVEAVYFLDFLTGDLKALVLGKQAMTFSGFFERNVGADLGFDMQKPRKFMMVTGLVNMRRSGGQRTFSGSVCYVAEVTSGKVAAYAVPWSPNMHSAGQAQSGPLALVGLAPFRTAAGTVPASGAGPAAPGPAK
jgi:hypothetical protein